MRQALAAWLRGRPQNRSQPPPEHRLAAAVLLVELARADFQRDATELDLIRQTLAAAFSLDADAAAALVDEAIERAREAVSLHEFIATLNRELAMEDKERLIGWLWQVAHADDHVDAREEALIRQLADWLHVRQAFVRERLRLSGG